MPDIATTTAGQPVTIAVLANDTGTGLTLTSLVNPANGTVSVNPDQSLLYTPFPGFDGMDSFIYTIQDAQGAAAQGTVTIEVLAPNDPPMANPDSVELFEGQQAIVPVLANDSDPDGDPLTIIAVGVPAHGAVQVLADQSIRYTPQPGFAGIDSLVYTVADGRGKQDQAAVTFHVMATNQAPVAVEDRVTAPTGQTTLIDVIANDNDPDGQALQLVAFTLPSAGSLSLDAALRFVYTPNAGYSGPDSFTYTIRDTVGAAATGLVTIDVQAPNQSPVALADSVETEINTPVTIMPLANDSDPDGDPIRIISLTMPTHGALNLDAGGGIVYTPANNFFGQDQFTYNIDDQRGGMALGVVNVTVLEPSVGQSHTNGFVNRRRLVVGGSVVRDTSLINFPLWLSFTEGWLRSVAHGGMVESDQGFDIRFELEDGTRLAHEIDLYDSLSGKLAVWVRVPELRQASDNVIFLFYGKPGLGVDEAQPAAVWQDYLAVWHLPGNDDSSPNGRTAVEVGTLVDNPDGLGGGTQLAGAGAYRIDDVSWLNGLSALTVQLRCKADVIGHDKGLLHSGTFGSDANSELVIRYDATGFGNGGPTNVIHAKAKTDAGNIGIASAAGSQTTDWQGIALAWQAGDTLASLFVDGDATHSSYENPVVGSTPTSLVTSGPLYIGAGPHDSATGGWVGAIDEVRFRAERLSDGWIATENSNHRDPSTFIGIGDADLGIDAESSVVAMPFIATLTSGKHIDLDVIAEAHLPAGSGTVEIDGIAQPAHGVVSVVGGLVRYTSEAGFAGEDRFTYSLRNGTKISQGTVALTIEQATQSTFPAPLRTINVTNASQLATALSNALPGDHITLASGTYSGTFSTSKAGVSGAPIVIRAADKLGATISGLINIDHVHVWVWGLTFENSTVYVRAGEIKLLRSRWQNGAPGKYCIRHIDGSGLEIGYCDFFNIGERAIEGEPRNGARQGHVHHCYFHKWPSYQTTAEPGRFAGRWGANDTESDINAACILEDNLFDNSEAGGIWPNEWCFEFKCSGNIIRRNTVRNVGSGRGTLGVRHGENNLVQSNRYIGSGAGIYTSDWNNQIIGNDVSACNYGIRVLAGQLDPTVKPYSGGSGLYPYALDALVAWNSGGVVVGFQYSDKQDDPDLKPAKNTRIEAHNGTVSLRVYNGVPAHAGTIQTSTSSVPNPGVAPTLTVADVGPDA